MAIRLRGIYGFPGRPTDSEPARSEFRSRARAKTLSAWLKFSGSPPSFVMIRKRLSRRAFDLDRVGVPAHDPLHRGKPSTRLMNLQTDGGTGLLVE